MRAMVLLVAVSLGGCGGGDECDQDGVAVVDPSQPAGGMNFELGPVLAQLEGSFSGTIETDQGSGPFALDAAVEGTPSVVYGEEGCRFGAYQVELRLGLDGAAQGVDAVSVVDVLLPEPLLALTLNDTKAIDVSGVSLTDPAMDDGDDVVVTLTSRSDGESWDGEVTWRFREGGFEPEGVLATWTASR
jgi:hypothetical protein